MLRFVVFYGVGVRCVVLFGVVLCVVVVCGPPRGGACCVGVWPPSWWGMLRWGVVCCVVWCCVLLWCVAPLAVGRDVVVCGRPRGRAVLGRVLLCPVTLRCDVLRCVVWCGGVRRPSWWGVLRRCMAPLMVGRGALGCGVLCFVAICCVWPCVTPLLVGCAALLCGPPHCGAWCVLVQCVVLRCVVLCVAPLMVGRAALVCGPPHGRAWRVRVWCVVL